MSICCNSRSLRSALCICTALVCTAGKRVDSLAAPPSGTNWEYVAELSDEFNVAHTNDSNDGINRSKWWDFHPTWTGRLPSQYSADNTRVEDGKLKLQATSMIADLSEVSDPNVDHWVDTGVVTSRAEARPGYFFEASIKVADVSAPSSWWFAQGSKSEIDVVENIGRPTNTDQTFRETKMAYNTHFFDPGPTATVGSEGPNSSTLGQMVDGSGNPLVARDHYVTYGMWWKSPTEIRYYYNGNEIANVAPGGDFDEGLNMLFDMEVFTFAGLPTIDSLQDPSRNTMQVDWVRAYRPTSAPPPAANLMGNPGFEASHPTEPARPDLWADCGKYDGCGTEVPFETRSNARSNSGDWSLQVDNQQANSFSQYKEIGTRDNIYAVLPGQTVHQEVWVNLDEAWDAANQMLVFGLRLNGDSSQPRTGSGQISDENGAVVETFANEVNYGRELPINDLFGGDQLDEWVKVEYDYVVPALDGNGNPVEYVTALSYIDNKTSAAQTGGLLFLDDFSFSIADPVVVGDFDSDGDVDHADVDALAIAARLGVGGTKFDLNNDGQVTFEINAVGGSDSDYLIHTILNTEYGDANLDGKVDVVDLDLLGQSYGVESGWLFGDFDGSGTTDLIDLDLFGQTFGFDASSPAQSVPEPATSLLTVFICLTSMAATRTY